MTLQDTALVAAGVIGAGTAILHGVLMQKFMVAPVDRWLKRDAAVSRQIRMLVASVLQYSTFSWLIGGLTLIVAALWLEPQARLALSLLVGAGYAYGVVANCWATRARHPGWMLLALSAGLTVAGNLGLPP
jgi:hypothetical protein